MSVKINYLNKTINNLTSNLVLFSNEKFDIKNLKKNLSNFEFLYINDLLKTSDLKKKILVFELNSKRKIILISIKKDLKTSEVESLGAELYVRINHGKNTVYTINSDSIISKQKEFICHFLHGLRLKSYNP